MLKKSTSWSVLIYGLILVGLGFYGYIQSASKVSLYAGAGFGGLLILSSIAMFANQKWGGLIALALTLSLTAIFAYRYSITTKAIPAILAVLSGFMLLFLLSQATSWKEKH